jgi:tRNA modification GTPase
MMLEDTIVAISTPRGHGGLGVIRLSGRKSLAIAGKLFRFRSGRRHGIPIRRPVLGNLVGSAGNDMLDEAFLTYFKAPQSYTREDVIELSCHGSPVVLEETVRLAVKSGARAAEPGEFTLRAYVNGRLDILQAEAVNDLIRAASLTQARLSFRQLSGSLSRKMYRLRDKLLHLVADVEAGIEFPDEGLRISPAKHSRALAHLAEALENLIVSYQTGRALSEGITLALAGRTNVGKSTLFNALLKEDRAIVTPYPGTTRDYLREDIVINDFVFHIIDMAGLGKPSHPVEQKGILKGRRIARLADGLLIVFDGSKKEIPEDLGLIRRFKGKRKVLVINKTDLPLKVDVAKIRGLAGDDPAVEISALRGTNMAELRDVILERFSPPPEIRGEVILHARQRDALIEVQAAVREAGRLLGLGYSDEIYGEEIRKAVSLIGRLTGEVRAEDVMTDIFDRFCVGK